MKPIRREELLHRFDGITQPRFTRPAPSKAIAAVAVEPDLIKALKAAVEVAEWFDFGELEADAGVRASLDARPFRRAGLMKPPYNLCVWRTRLSSRDRDPGASLQPPRDALLIIIAATPENVDALNRNIGSPLTANHDSIVFVVLTAEDGFTQLVDTIRIKSVLPEALPNMPDAEGVYQVHTGMLYDALWLVLNTKGIRKTVDVPDARLNKARARLGRAPLRQVTRIDAAQYMRALDETERMERDGHHASPRMHLRRAHLRWLKAERYSPEAKARPIVIEATIVNMDSDSVAVRERYEVRT